MKLTQTHIDTAERAVHSGRCKLDSLIISHAETGAQTVRVYDGVDSIAGRLVLQLVINPNLAPVTLIFEPNMELSDGFVVVPAAAQVEATSYGN